jgi:hypothetical protein
MELKKPKTYDIDPAEVAEFVWSELSHNRDVTKYMNILSAAALVAPVGEAGPMRALAGATAVCFALGKAARAAGLQTRLDNDPFYANQSNYLLFAQASLRQAPAARVAKDGKVPFVESVALVAALGLASAKHIGVDRLLKAGNPFSALEEPRTVKVEITKMPDSTTDVSVFRNSDGYIERAIQATEWGA